MKSILILQSLSLFCLVLLLSTVESSRSSNLKSSLGITSKSLEGSMLSQNELATYWSNLFSGTRGQTCAADEMKAKVIRALLAEGLVPGIPGTNGSKAEKSKFSWVKKWGYGESSYLLDFFDPLFQKDAVAAFKQVYNELMAISNADTEKFQDPFNLQKLNAGKLKVSLENLNKNYNKAMYEISVNAVQLNEAMKKWNWYVTPGETDYAANFISKYDFNGDGRLNPRELIIGVIHHNKGAIGSAPCTNCFQDIGKKMDAIFIFLDCNNDGFMSAEDIWNNLPKLNRPDTKWNIFSFKNKDNIRTSAINDFVIKNGGALDGSISKDDFRTGLLLGLWDRQTRESSIVEDDSRNLKYLRWTDGGMTDTAAFNHMKEEVLAQLIARSQ